MIWLALLLPLLLPSWSDAACTKASTTFTCTGDLATLRNLFVSDIPSAVLDGDTVSVSAGTYFWTGQLVIGEGKAVPGFTLVGAGEGVTIFKRDPTYQDGTAGGAPAGSLGGFLVIQVLATSSLTRLTAFTIDGNSSSGAPSGGYIVMMGAGLDKFRIDHVTLDHIKGSRGFVTDGNRSSTGGLEFSGLFDHVTCNTVAGGSTDCFAIYGSWSGGNDKQFQWTKPLGNNHATYVEDSVCNFLGTSDDCTDGKLGGAFVFRYNTVNYGWGSHGADSSFRGNRSMEIYRTRFLDTPTTTHTGLNFRGGGDLAFDNTFHADFINSTFTLYRTSGYGGWGSFAESPARAQCNGSSTWDGNLGSGTPASGGSTPVGNPGWPCLDQPGWYFPGPGAHGSTVQFWPAYYFRNTYTVGGANVPFHHNDQIATPPTNGSTWSTGYIVANQDYYTDGGASCTGGGACTSGVGVGTSLPTTCTTDSATTALAATRGGGTGGVGFWKTNEGTWNTSTTDAAFNPSGVAGENGRLYKCTATNTWTLYYTPYTYPHPLQGAAPAVPAAPTNLRTIGTSTGTICTVVWDAAGLANLVGYHLSYGTSTGAYTTTINKTDALSAAAFQPPRRHTFVFEVPGTYYISVTGYSDIVSDTASATEITCVSTGISRSAAGARIGGAH